MIPPLRKSLKKSCSAHKSAALDLENGARAPLNQSNLLLGVSGTQQAAFSDQRDTDVFMIPLLEGSEVSQLALESQARGLLDVCSQLLKLNAGRVWNPEDQTSAGTKPKSQPGYVYQVLMGTELTVCTHIVTAELSSTPTRSVWTDLSVLTLTLSLTLRRFEKIMKLHRFTNLIKMQS